MLSYPLTRSNRLKLARAFATTPRVDISIEALIEDQVGEAFVDDLESPTAYFILSGGFFGYFAGDPASTGSRALVEAIKGGKMIFPAADGWFELIQSVCAERARLIDRWSMSSASLSLDALPAANVPVTIDRLTVDNLQNKPGYVELDAFDSQQDFVERSIGFAAFDDGRIVGSAIGACVSARAIEISIFVENDYRRQGVATALGASLLRWCLEHHIEPHWDAANPESVKLAQKLGCTEAGQYQAIYLTHNI